MGEGTLSIPLRVAIREGWHLIIRSPSSQHFPSPLAVFWSTRSQSLLTAERLDLPQGAVLIHRVKLCFDDVRALNVFLELSISMNDSLYLPKEVKVTCKPLVSLPLSSLGTDKVAKSMV
jgi:hypothetical protein